MEKELLTAGSLALEQKQRSVIVIDATEHPREVKLRVAAYCRVSSDSDDQLNSFAAQNQYYTTLIASKENWALVDIYADEGITGTSAQKRADFQRLMADCRRGLIDRVLTKSVSRFARNTKECLEAIRELKALGIGVQFEKEHLDTATMSGEMTAAMFAAFAQAESESISGNMRWSYLKRMQNGTFIPPYLPYGYCLRDGKIQPEPAQAAIVQRIFQEYLSGRSADDIANGLCADLIPGKSGKISWDSSSVRYILTNEKYIGDSIWQKYFTTSTLPHRTVRNHGEVDSYHASQTHVPLVTEACFRSANALLEKRSQQITCAEGRLFALRQTIFCGTCGSVFRRKVIRDKVYWACIGREKGRNRNCNILEVPEETVQQAFLRLYYKLRHQGMSVLRQLQKDLLSIRGRGMLWSADIIALNQQIANLTSQSHILAQLKQQGLVDPGVFISKSNQLAEQLRAAQLQKERLLEDSGAETISQTRELLEILEDGPEFLESFDEELFRQLVDKIIVESQERLRFRLKNGLELTEAIERKVR